MDHIEDDGNDKIPEIDLRLTATPVVAKPRTLKTQWSAEAAGGPRRRFIDVVERLAAIDAGKPDPGEWEELPPDPNSLQSLYGLDVEAELVEKMAEEMAEEEEKEVQKAIARGPRPVAEIDATIEAELRFAAEQARQGSIYHALGETVRDLLHERDWAERVSRRREPGA